jgi:hypothetical protein
MSATYPLDHLSHWSAHPAQDDGTELGDYLSARCLPATRDELQAMLVRHHAPTRLLWQLARLAPTTTYTSLDEVYAAVEAPAAPSVPREPY